MNDISQTEDIRGIAVRPSSQRPMAMKTTASGRSTPGSSSPSYQRQFSVRTPRSTGGGSSPCVFQCFKGTGIVYWLVLITLWAYGAFHIQSRWAISDKQDNFIDGFGHELDDEDMNPGQIGERGRMFSDDDLVNSRKASEMSTHLVGVTRISGNVDVALAREEEEPILYGPSLPSKKMHINRFTRAAKSSRRRGMIGLSGTTKAVKDTVEVEEEKTLSHNSSDALLVGPFGSIEDRVLEWSQDNRTGTCERQELFGKLVRSRKFVLIFHELSMTGAPISMLGMATELLSCGATVHAVVLSRRGGLMPELSRRNIKVVDDKDELSFEAAMKADIVIAGSAVCDRWIENYLAKYRAGGKQTAWWIMENRREYFDRSKSVLGRVEMLIFISESQTRRWLAWSKEENIKLPSQRALIPLSVNDELAFVAGIPCSLNTPTLTPQKMLEKKQRLRQEVRREMGLNENDMLVMSLSSLNAAKGQLLLLETANMILNEESFHPVVGDPLIQSWLKKSVQKRSELVKKAKLRVSSQYHQTLVDDDEFDGSNDGEEVRSSNGEDDHPKKDSQKNLKILIGSVGSKSNKPSYVKEMIEFLSENPKLSRSVLWTPATTRVASLYSAADVYVINSQGLGETFGRVTIEAMAFGLPVLGTNAGGTMEIVDQNITGLLHPVGRPGRKTLAQNINFLMNNPSIRKQMGIKGREKVEKMYLKRHMYRIFFEVLFKCMRRIRLDGKSF